MSSAPAAVPKKEKEDDKEKEKIAREELKEVFSVFDKDGDGSLTSDELIDIMNKVVRRKKGKETIAFTPAEIKQIVAEFDDNGDGSIDFEEFVHMMTSHDGKHDELKEAFAYFDADGDGAITKKEIASVFQLLGENMPEDTINLMLQAVDENGDGTISFDEFCLMMKDDAPRDFK